MTETPVLTRNTPKVVFVVYYKRSHLGIKSIDVEGRI